MEQKQRQALALLKANLTLRLSRELDEPIVLAVQKIRQPQHGGGIMILDFDKAAVEVANTGGIK